MWGLPPFDKHHDGEEKRNNGMTILSQHVVVGLVITWGDVKAIRRWPSGKIALLRSHDEVSGLAVYATTRRPTVSVPFIIKN